MKAAQTQFDICIIGGGMVGLTMAQLIAAECPKAKVALIEQQAFSQASDLYQPSFDARSTALSLGSAEIFSAIHLWETIKQRATPILSVHVSDKGHIGTTAFSDSETGNPLGYVVENAWMGRCLVDALAQYENITVFAPAKVSDISVKKNTAKVTIESENKHATIAAELVVIADGANSPLREKLGIAVETKQYQQHAVIANVECGEPHMGRAFERFTSQGPVALLPQGYEKTAKRCALVYTRPNSEVEKTLALDDEAFLRELQNAFGYRLGKFIKVGKRQSYPLSLCFAKEQVRSSIVLMGNAAHFLHPVAGQGFNLALRDVAQLIAALKPTYNLRQEGKEKNYGELQTLLNYIAAQARDQSLTSTISDGFNTVFSNNNSINQLGRNVGLIALELSSGLKKEVFHRMMGETQVRAKLDVFEGLA